MSTISTQVYLVLRDLAWNFHWLLLASVLIFLVLWLVGLQNRRAVLLFSLALPGAMVWCAIMITLPFVNVMPDITRTIVVFAVAFPSVWALPSIAVFQFLRLRGPATNIGIRGFALAFVIVALYAWTTVMDRSLKYVATPRSGSHLAEAQRVEQDIFCWCAHRKKPRAETRG